MIQAVIIGFQHMHVNEVALYISRHPAFTLAGAADTDSGIETIGQRRYTAAWNRENVRKNYGVPIFDDYRQMLDELRPDIAFILTENVRKRAIAEACIRRGIDVILEKPAAMNAREIQEIEALALRHGVEAFVNWPVLWRPYLHRFEAALASGLIGTPLKLQYINGHTGPLGKGALHRGVQEKAEEMTDEERRKTWWHQGKYGGGVFLDIGCYGCFFSTWLLGENALSAMAIGKELNTPYGDTADNFAAFIRYEKQMAVIEGTWTTPRAVIPSGPVVLGTDGVLVCTGGAENSPGVAAFDIYGKPLDVPETTFPDFMTDMPHLVAHHKETGLPMPEMTTLRKNARVAAILDAVILSAQTGKEEPVRV